jgi:hypothetical protein
MWVRSVGGTILTSWKGSTGRKIFSSAPFSTGPRGWVDGGYPSATARPYTVVTFWRLLSCDMGLRVVRQKCTDFSEIPAVSIFRVDDSKYLQSLKDIICHRSPAHRLFLNKWARNIQIEFLWVLVVTEHVLAGTHNTFCLVPTTRSGW